MAGHLPITDGVIAIRELRKDDGALLVAGRDTEFHRFLGDGDPDPRPTACIDLLPSPGDRADAQLVGWVDFDVEREWRLPGEVNIGYHVFARRRGSGIGTRALQLLMHHLALAGEHQVATLLIDAANTRSQALAARARFPRVEDFDGHPYFKRAIPPLTYTDGGVTIRRRTAAELAGTDDGFGHGPSWTFAIDTAVRAGVGTVRCDLSDERVAHGAASITTSLGIDCGAVAARLAMQFLRDHTGTRAVQVIVAR